MILNHNKPSLQSWILLIVLAFIWGSSFILMKLGLFTPNNEVMFSGTELASIRLTISALVLFPLVIKHRKTYTQNIKPLLIVALFGNGFPAFLFAIAQTEVNSSVAGILNVLTPVFTFIISVIVYKLAYSRYNIYGLALGIIGAIGIALIGNTGASNNLAYAFLIFIATICYAISLNTMKYKLAHLSSITITALSLFLTLPMALFFGVNKTLYSKFTSNDYAWEALGYIAVLAIIGTSLALILFNKLVKTSNTLFASSVTYLIPVVALFWGIQFNEPIGVYHIIFGTILLSGIYLISSSKNRT